MKTLFKTVRREIKHSLGRFAAIFAITALGVGFLAGLLSTTPDFYSTIDTYYDSLDFMDLNIKSSGGLTDADLEALRGEDYVAAATPAKVQDVIARNEEGDDNVARVYGIDISAVENEESFVNRLELVEGRYPKNSNECVALYANVMDGRPELGSKLSLKDESGAFENTELEIVGIAESPVYMSVERESSDIGNGRVTLVLYTFEDIFNTDYYTDIFLTLKGAEELNAFYDPYKELCDESSEKLEDVASLREEERFDELKTLAADTALATDEGKAMAAMGLESEVVKKAEESVSRPEWYILDRDTNPSFVSLTSNAEKVNAIAKVFPLFFFLVAALVSLTTMTRMVDEQRTEIGTLKALGYSGRAISAKYLIYSGVAALAGGFAGLAAGLFVLPEVIINVYRIMYRVPDVIINFNWQISVTALSVAVICIIGATLAAVVSNLKELPARLMLPKAPKLGKRILLERIGFIWNRMKFTHKVTARNLFRYKKRFFMTVIGIAGCTALLLTGFGLRDAIGDIVPKQYEEIQQYDLTVELDRDADHTGVYDYLDENGCEYFNVHAENGTVHESGETYEINIYVPSSADGFEEYMDIRERKSGESIAFDDSSLIITEKFADNHNLSVGSTVTLENNDGKTAEAEVTGICENYIYSYVYMSGEKYGELFGEDCEYTTLLVKTDFEDEDAAMSELLAVSGVSSASFSSVIIESFENMVGSINYIVVVLIMAAGMLAFVVLYNLTNINIGERQKEIATIKVLGFYDKEVNAYVHRETYILSMIGTLVGLVLGIFLCRFVVTTAEVDMVMFGRDIYWYSYVYSAVITVLFTVAVNLAMAIKLKKIDMVESMESVD